MALRERKARVGAIPEGGMADIAFLLLVFFLVTTTIDMDKGLGIILPAEGQELEINKKNILNCLISASGNVLLGGCLLYTSPSPRDRTRSRMPSSA